MASLFIEPVPKMLLRTSIVVKVGICAGQRRFATEAPKAPKSPPKPKQEARTAKSNRSGGKKASNLVADENQVRFSFPECSSA